MKTVNKISELRNIVFDHRNRRNKIGFVPTMGFLHEGHLSLVRKAREENDFVVVSIYVNPTQFAPDEDLESYPRDLEKDSRLLENEGTDLLFFPDNKMIYPDGFETYIELENLPRHLCGLSRPTHFKGVATIVAKLFNIVQPDKAYFGQKDYQQFLIIKKMARDLNFPVEPVMCPIVREDDGLALSSRNTYLNEDQRKDSILLNKALNLGRELILQKGFSISEIKTRMRKIIETSPHAEIDYLQILDGCNLNEIDDLRSYNGKILLAGAVHFGPARLIDNLLIYSDSQFAN